MIIITLIPTVLEKENNTERAYDLYSRLLKDRIIFIDGEITDTLSNIVVSQLLYLNHDSNEEISLYINSPGGSVTAGLAIYDTMNFIKADVRTIGIGICASMGAFLLSSGTKGKRNVLPNTEVMIHQPLGGVKGKATDIEIASNHIIKTKEKLNKILAKNTGKTLKKITLDTEKDYYMNAEEAFKYGIIDEIIK